MATIVVAHGAWSSAWAWQKMRPLLRAAGHDIFTPSYTGLGERAHLASPAIDLDTHIADVLGVLQFEDLRDVVLIGHSYGGMVATGVADRADGRVATADLSRCVRAEGWAEPVRSCRSRRPKPRCGRARRRPERAGRCRPIRCRRIRPRIMPPGPRRGGCRSRSNASSRNLHCPVGRCRRAATSIASAARPDDVFRQFADRAKAEGWRYAEMDASHNPHITAPEELRDVLQEMMK